MKRRCGWLPRALQTPERVVWARNHAATTICPKSLISAQSSAWLEEYLVRRKLEERGIEGLGARQVEAFLLLEHELAQMNRTAGAGNSIGALAQRGANA